MSCPSCLTLTHDQRTQAAMELKKEIYRDFE